MAGAEGGSIDPETAVRYLGRMEQQLVARAGQLQAEIDHRRDLDPADGGWRSPAEARTIIANLDDEQAEAQFGAAAQQIVDDLATLPAIYHTMLRPEIDEPDPGPAVRDLLLSLHNPMVRESLLIPVADAYEDAVRDWFAEIAAVCWGFIEVTAGEAGPHHRKYAAHLAEMWGIDDLDRLVEALGLG